MTMRDSGPRLQDLLDFVEKLGRAQRRGYGLFGAAYDEFMARHGARRPSPASSTLVQAPPGVRRGPTSGRVTAVAYPSSAPTGQAVASPARPAGSVTLADPLEAFGGRRSPLAPRINLPPGLAPTPGSQAKPAWADPRMLVAAPDTVDRPQPAPLDAFGPMPVGAKAQAAALGAGKGGGLNGLGYQPKPSDFNTLARMIYAEGSNTPEDYGALGWSMVNRVGRREFGGSLEGLTRRPREYSFSPNAKQPHGSARWIESASPETLSGPAAASWKRAEATAKGILDGQIPDPTGGATFFFSSDSYDGRPETAMGSWYQGRLRDGALVPSPYQSASRIPTKNYFFKEAPPKPAR